MPVCDRTREALREQPGTSTTGKSTSDACVGISASTRVSEGGFGRRRRALQALAPGSSESVPAGQAVQPLLPLPTVSLKEPLGQSVQPPKLRMPSSG